MSTAIISILVVGIAMYAIDGCPVVVNGSCCEIRDHDFKFSLQTLSGVYTASPISVETANQ